MTGHGATKSPRDVSRGSALHQGAADPRRKTKLTKLGLLLGYRREGEAVFVEFEFAVLEMSRSQGIGLAYCLSDLVE